MREGCKEAIPCAEIAVVHFSKDLSETLKKKPYTIEQKQGLHRNSLYFPQTFVQ